MGELVGNRVAAKGNVVSICVGRVASVGLPLEGSSVGSPLGSDVGLPVGLSEICVDGQRLGSSVGSDTG